MKQFPSYFRLFLYQVLSFSFNLYNNTLYVKSCFHSMDREALQPLNNVLKVSAFVNLIDDSKIFLNISENKTVIEGLISFIDNDVIGKLIRDNYPPYHPCFHISTSLLSTLW